LTQKDKLWCSNGQIITLHQKTWKILPLKRYHFCLRSFVLCKVWVFIKWRRFMKQPELFICIKQFIENTIFFLIKTKQNKVAKLAKHAS